ncbi:MAG: TetR/AcrR family transcriptional regulator, partial [Caulobacteraceae bacterium]
LVPGFLHGMAPQGAVWQPEAIPMDSLAAREGPDLAQETFLLAATRLINRRGYRGASVDKISAELNVTKGSFYHHNEDKDDLVLACFDRTFTVLRAAQLAARDLKADQWTRLAAAASALTEFQLSEDGPLLRGSSMTALPIEVRQDISDRYARVSDRFAGMISDGIAEGSIRPVDPLVAAHMLNALLNAAASMGAWVTGLEKDEAAGLFVRPLLLGLFTR